MGNGITVRMVGVMQYQISHAPSLQQMATVSFTLYDWHPDELSDVPPLIRPTINICVLLDNTHIVPRLIANTMTFVLEITTT